MGEKRFDRVNTDMMKIKNSLSKSLTHEAYKPYSQNIETKNVEELAILSLRKELQRKDKIISRSVILYQRNILNDIISRLQSKLECKEVDRLGDYGSIKR